MEQQPELVGPEAMVAEAVGEAGDFEILDRVLAVAALDVPVVERLGRIRARGDHEAGVRPLRQRFGFDDHAPRVVPTLRLVDGLAEEPDFVHPGCRPLPLRLGARGAASAVRRGLVTRPMV